MRLVIIRTACHWRQAFHTLATFRWPTPVNALEFELKAVGTIPVNGFRHDEVDYALVSDTSVFLIHPKTDTTLAFDDASPVVTARVRTGRLSSVSYA
jgi:hypothetical protein